MFTDIESQMIEEVEAIGCKLDFYQKRLDDEHLNCLWYGGDFAVVKNEKENFNVFIGAYGDVEGYLYDENENIIAEFKDRGNHGYFYNEVDRYIKNDTELVDALMSDRLILNYNNWWELLVIKNGECYDLLWSAESDDWNEAIREVIETMPELIERFGNNGTEI